MPTGLVRHQDKGHLHFLTFSCVRKRNILGTPDSRDTFVKILEQTREKYAVAIHGYVVMPNHVHLLTNEPEVEPLATVMQVIKQRFSRTRSEDDVWESRYYDFNVYTHDKRVEKLKYIHRNPVTRGLVETPDQWHWSSFNFYLTNAPNPVTLTRY